MITGIQQRAPAVDLTQRAGNPKSTAADVSMKPLGVTPREDDTPVFFRQNRAEIPKTGFGDGTVSTPTAVMRTLTGGLESARRIVPTTQELRDQLRREAAAKREAAARETRQPNNTQPDKRFTDTAAQQAVAQTRTFANSVNQAVGVAQARIAGEPQPGEAPAAQIPINGETFRYTRSQTDVGFPVAPKFNVLV